MKKPINRLKVKKLYVLGAGASYAASSRKVPSNFTAPLDKDFCQRIKSISAQRPQWVNQIKTNIINKWADEIPFHSFGLEEAIIKQIGYLQFFDAIYRKKRTSYKIEDYVDNVSHIINYILSKTSESPSKLYEKLFLKIKNDFDIDSESTRIITFNYDTLLDKYFLSNFEPAKIYFDKINISRNTQRRIIKYDNPFLIKLHGSNNWRCSNDEYKSLITNLNSSNANQMIDKIWIEKKISSPDDLKSPLIIPPLPNKPVTKISLFKYLWTKASEYLHEAEEIIVCGYSLPHTDSLALALFGSFYNKRLKKVTVVDPNAEILTKWRNLFNRKNVNKAMWTYYYDLN